MGGYPKHLRQTAGGERLTAKDYRERIRQKLDCNTSDGQPFRIGELEELDAQLGDD